MEKYWVVGGEYESTDFRRMAGGKPEERHGPFASLADARAKWAGLSMSTVDNAHVRYRIFTERKDEKASVLEHKAFLSHMSILSSELDQASRARVIAAAERSEHPLLI